MYYFTLLCHRLRQYRLACSKRFKQNSLLISRTNIVMLFFSSVCVMIHLMFSFFHIGYCWHNRHTLESLTFSVCKISDFLLFTFCSPCQGSLKCYPVCFQLNLKTAWFISWPILWPGSIDSEKSNSITQYNVTLSAFLVVLRSPMSSLRRLCNDYFTFKHLVNVIQHS